MARTIDTFTVARSTEGYLLQLEDEDGESVEFVASYDQLEMIADEIERFLGQDEDEELVPEGDDGPDEAEEM
jgi:hypothetical protein